ncbi:MAG: protein kinase [Vicinamibacterales bacterium]
MALTPGTRLGPYEVVAQIGAGGMGEVYRATDSNLKRSVAIKVLPASVVGDADRLARFQREAEVLAALNHPNIAAIYGLEKTPEFTALVMELVEGEDLSQRIARGAIPIDEALPIAKQIADALEAAHEQGIIHRDLKPANIKVRLDGTVKVLDFGLAKAMEAPGAMSPNVSQAPTITTPAMMTGVGMILGTAAYMSPEQARGKTVDKRADIWAFGAVLFEMLTGQRAFAGDDVSDVLASVLAREPDFGALPPSVPARITQALRLCLRKDPKQRVGDIRDVRLALDGAFETAAPASSTVAPVVVSRPRERVAWTALGVVSLAALALAAFISLGRAPADVRQMRFLVSPPDGWRVTTATGPTGASPAPLAVSPDGSRVAFLATAATGSSRLWVRALDTLTAQELPGTDGAAAPFWSPDSRFLGFFAEGTLKKIDVSGGPAVTLCATPEFRGGTWSRDGVIVFASSSASALQKVSAAGGVPSAATALEDGDAGHARPSFLPDGKHFVYRVQGGPNDGIYVASLDAPARTLLLKSPGSTNTLYAQGHLLFMREETLMAQPFDLGRLTLTGEPLPIAEQVVRSTSSPPSGVFSASDTGVLAYQAGEGSAGSRLVWFDRAGKQLAVLGEAAAYFDLDLSPDGRQASVSLRGGGGADIWLYDVVRGIRNRFTFDPADEMALIWSPDGRQTVFSSRRKAQLDLYLKSADGSSTEEVLLEDKLAKIPLSWSADGKSLLYRSNGEATGSDLFVLPLSGDRTPTPFVNTPFSELSGQFSPDGRWVAYVSNESGRNEVYVAPFPGPGGRRQVSTAGGDLPRWRRDGTEVFYVDPDRKIVAAAVNGRGASFEVGAVKPLFETSIVTGMRHGYAVTADGQRFLINTDSEQAAATPITVVTNWDAGLKP